VEPVGVQQERVKHAGWKKGEGVGPPMKARKGWWNLGRSNGGRKTQHRKDDIRDSGEKKREGEAVRMRGIKLVTLS